MFPPVPAIVSGSMAQPAGGAVPGHTTGLPFAGLAAAAALAAGLSATLAGADWLLTLKAASAAMLVPGLTGLWHTRQTRHATARLAAWLHDQVSHKVAQDQPCAIHRGPEEDAFASFTGLFAGLVVRHRRLQVGHARNAAAAAAGTAALQAGRNQADNLAARLRGDGEAMAHAASGIIAASAELQGQAQQVSAGAHRAGQSVGSLAERATTLAASIRTVTGQVTQMTEIAVNAADCAYATQIDLVALSERAIALGRTVDQVGRAMPQPVSDSADGPDAASLAASLHDLTQTVAETLAGVHAIIAELRTEAGAGARRVADLCAILHNQTTLSAELGLTVEQQGDEIAGVLAAICDAEDGWSELRAGMDAIGCINHTRIADAETLRGAADQVPAHAETIARILRSIPDFAPSAD